MSPRRWPSGTACRAAPRPERAARRGSHAERTKVALHGLAIVAEQAAALGAGIAFDTAPGQGMRVRVTLPG